MLYSKKNQNRHKGVDIHVEFENYQVFIMSFRWAQLFCSSF